jgi:hypothetical protein
MIKGACVPVYSQAIICEQAPDCKDLFGT